MLLVLIVSWIFSRVLVKQFKALFFPGHHEDKIQPHEAPVATEKDRKAKRGIFSLAFEIFAAVGLNLIRDYAKTWSSELLAKERSVVPKAAGMKVIQGGTPTVRSQKAAVSPEPAAEPPKAERSYQKNLFSLLKNTAAEWIADKCPQLGAALAYFTVFSLAPLVLVLLAVFGIIFGSNENARNRITDQLSYFMDPSGVKVISDIASNASEKKAGIIATSVGIVLALVGASGVFGQLQDALNTIWGVKSKPGAGWWDFLRKRFLSFSMVGGVCFLLLVSLTVESLLRAVNQFLDHLIPGGNLVALALFFVFDLGVIILLFAMIFRYLPDVKIPWRDVWVGAALTAILFVIGKFALGLYLGSGAAGSPYGAAGSLITLLLWIYYAAQILLFGAEFTQVYANTYGVRFEPEDHAIRVKRTETEIPTNQ
jgi:membrane protein